MKAATVLICVFVKKARVDLRPDIFYPLRGVAEVVEPLLTRPSRKDSSVEGGDSINCEDSSPVFDGIVVAIVLVLMFVAFAVMEIDVARKRGDNFSKAYVFTARAKVAPENTLPSLLAQTKSLELNGNQQAPKCSGGTRLKQRKSNGSLRFRRGFLSKRRSSSTNSRSNKSKSTKSGIAPLVDITKPAKEVMRGNASLVYDLFGEDGNEIAIFKPYSNGGFSSTGQILTSQQQCVNEVAAFVFDQMISSVAQAGVPETQHAEFPGSLFEPEELRAKAVKGSLQAYISNTESCEDYGYNMFSTSDVQKLGVLDLRILNCDRHSGNILIDTSSKKLYPIDHALAFPAVDFDIDGSLAQAVDKNVDNLHLADISFDWMMFPQAKEPFSDEMLQGIRSINITEDLRVMKDMGMSVKQRLAVFMSETVLKTCALAMQKISMRLGQCCKDLALGLKRQSWNVLQDKLFRKLTEKNLQDLTRLSLLCSAPLSSIIWKNSSNYSASPFPNVYDPWV